jgi:hypothetical protein
MNDASFFGSNHDQPPIPESASALKRRRFAYDSIDRVLLAQRTIQEALVEHGSGGSCCWPIPAESGPDARSDQRSQQPQVHRDGTEVKHQRKQQHQQQKPSSAPSPAHSNRSNNDEFVMTNEEWLDLLRQVQDELDIDTDGVDNVDLNPDGWSETEEERLLEEARAEQAYWDGMAEEWMEREGGADLSKAPGTTTSELDDEGQSTEVVCPVCQEACLSFVANEWDEAEQDDANEGSGCGPSGSIVCPNHMDGSCSMRIDSVPLHSRTKGQDGDPTSSVVGQHAMETLRRRLGHLSYEHGGSTCTHPLAFEVTDQVLHARCAYCGGSKSVLLASWFHSHRRGCSS